MSIKIGVSANLDKGASVHRSTFFEGVHIGLGISGCMDDVGLVFISDSATRAGGSIAASTILQHGVDAVVGHYASAAACSACAVYKQSRLPVFLPAATHPDLDRVDENVFQICPNDKVLCDQIFNYVKYLGSSEVYLECDNTVHGSTIITILTTLFSMSGIGITTNLQTCECVVFSGMFVNSIQYVSRVRQEYTSVPVILTDDALHASVVDNLRGINNVYIFGNLPTRSNDICKAFVEDYWRFTNKEPATYLIETVISMEMAIQSKHMVPDVSTGLNGRNVLWRTILGNRTVGDIKDVLTDHVMWEINNGRTIHTSLPSPSQGERSDGEKPSIAG